MPTLKPVLKDYKRADGKYSIFIRVTHKRKVNYIITPYQIEKRYFKNSKATPQYSLQAKLNNALYSLLIEYNSTILDIGPAIRNMDISTLISKLKGDQEKISFTKYAERRMKLLNKEGRYSTAGIIEVLLIHLKNFKKEIFFKDITTNFFEKFDTYLRVKGCSLNTRKIYLNNIQSIFNKAASEDVTKLSPPKIKIKSEIPEKRALNMEEIRKLMNGKYPYAQRRSIDIWMLILYLIGINLKDLLYLTPDRVQSGRINYKRAKTQTPFSVKIYPEAQTIIDKYKGRKYLLKFLDEDDSFKAYKNFMKATNHRLTLAFGKKLTTYASRHSWATIAQSIGITRDDVRNALGHDIKRLTDRYITYDQKRIDEANAKVIAFLNDHIVNSVEG